MHYQCKLVLQFTTLQFMVGPRELCQRNRLKSQTYCLNYWCPSIW